MLFVFLVLIGLNYISDRGFKKEVKLVLQILTPTIYGTLPWANNVNTLGKLLKIFVARLDLAMVRFEK